MEALSMPAAVPSYRIDPFGHTLDELVLHALRRSPWVGRQVQVEVVDGSIVLRGAVRSYFQKQMAQETLLGIAGKSRVVNELVVAAN